MQASIQSLNGIVIFRLEGQLDYESVDKFHHQSVDKLKAQSLIFCFKKVSFVGSTAIYPFFETLAVLEGQNANRIKVSGMSSELRRIFEVSPVRHLDVCPDIPTAQYRFLNPAEPIQQPTPSSYFHHEKPQSTNGFRSSEEEEVVASNLSQSANIES